MAETHTEQYFRDPRRGWPWLIGAVVLFAGAYMLALFLHFAGWAVIAFVVGLIAFASGLKLMRQPAARLSGSVLTLSDPRGLSMTSRTYSLSQIKRVSIETRRANVPNRLRRDVLMVNLTGVPEERVKAFAQAMRERNVQVDY
ncbi:MAG TPA: hypothetical protein VFH85_06860 [Gammaproteobacteria bacterium]|nr:hypothetical protein [Gammaproteobacteria bacterium]